MRNSRALCFASGKSIAKTMLNNNIFRQAKELLQAKSIDEMTQEEVLTIKAATIPLDILPEFSDMTTEEGLEYLARLF